MLPLATERKSLRSKQRTSTQRPMLTSAVVCGGGPSGGGMIGGEGAICVFVGADGAVGAEEGLPARRLGCGAAGPSSDRVEVPELEGLDEAACRSGRICAPRTGVVGGRVGGYVVDGGPGAEGAARSPGIAGESVVSWGGLRSRRSRPRSTGGTHRTWASMRM